MEECIRTVPHGFHFPDLPGGEIAIEGTIVKHCTKAATKKSPRIKMGWKKKRREHCSKIELVLTQKEEGKKKQPKKDPILERWRKSVRTDLHGRHFPDLPFGEITIEGTSIVKHCTTAATKKSPRIKMGWKKKEEKTLFKKRISAGTERKEGDERKQPKKHPILERRGEECTYLHTCSSLSRPAIWRDHD